MIHVHRASRARRRFFLKKSVLPQTDRRINPLGASLSQARVTRIFESGLKYFHEVLHRLLFNPDLSYYLTMLRLPSWTPLFEMKRNFCELVAS